MAAPDGFRSRAKLQTLLHDCGLTMQIPTPNKREPGSALPMIHVRVGGQLQSVRHSEMSKLEIGVCVFGAGGS